MDTTFDSVGATPGLVELDRALRTRRGRHGIRGLAPIGLAAALFLGGIGFERAATPAAPAGPADPTEFALIAQAWDLLHARYVDAANLDPTALAHGAIDGMTYAVGDTGHTYLLTPDQASAADDALEASAVDWAMIPGTKFALIRLSVFSHGCAEEVRKAVGAALRVHATGLVLDLRGNPGGYTEEAVRLASLFLEPDEVVTRSRDADGVESVSMVPSDAVTIRLPLVVLVDHDSASSSEVVVGALQDYQRATIVGAATTGTGTGLEGFPLVDGSELWIGTERWLTPAGRSAWHVGLAPDVPVAMPTGAIAVTPDRLSRLGVKGLARSGDTQLLRAIDLLRTP